MTMSSSPSPSQSTTHIFRRPLDPARPRPVKSQPETPIGLPVSSSIRARRGGRRTRLPLRSVRSQNARYPSVSTRRISMSPSRFMSYMTGFVRHCVRIPFDPLGFIQPHFSSGCAPSHSTSTAIGAASFGAVRVPIFRHQRTSPRMVLSITSGRPSPSQSPVDRHI